MWENCETHRGKGEGDGIEFVLLLTITINCQGISQETETVDPWTLKVWMLDPSLTTTLTSCQVATNHPTCPMKVFESLYNCYVWSTGTSWEFLTSIGNTEETIGITVTFLPVTRCVRNDVSPRIFVDSVAIPSFLVLFETNTANKIIDSLFCGTLAPFPVRPIFSEVIDVSMCHHDAWTLIHETCTASKLRQAKTEKVDWSRVLVASCQVVVEWRPKESFLGFFCFAILPGKYSGACNGFELDLRFLVFGVFHVFSKSWRPMKMNFKTFIPWEGIARLHVCSKHKLIWHWKSASTCRGQPPKMKS